MSMWGVKKEKKEPKENKENKKYLELTDIEIREYQEKYLKMPPTSYARERVKQGVEGGIPLEFFVDTGIVTEDNLYTLDFDSEFLKRFLDYIRYKNGDSSEDYPEDTYDKIDETQLSTKPEEPQLDTEAEEPEKDTEDASKIDKEKDDSSPKKNDNKSEDLIEQEMKKIAEEISKTLETATEIETSDNHVNAETTEEIINKIEDELKEELAEVEKEVEVVYRQEDIDLIRSELTNTHNIKIQTLEDSYKGTIKGLEKEISVKTDKIISLENKIKTLIDNNSGSLNRLSEARKEIAGYMTEIKELNNEVYKLKRIQAQYDSIKDDYVRFKASHESREKEKKEIAEKHSKELEEYKDRAERAEKAYNDIQKVFHEFYTEGTQEVAYFTSSTTNNMVYFKMLGEPKYFYTMLRYMRQIIKNKGKKLLTVAFKNVNSLEGNLWDDWIDLKDTHSIEDMGNYDYKLVSGSMDRVMASKMDGILSEFDFIIVLDYLVGDKLQITSPRIEEIVVLRNEKQKKLLGSDFDKVVSEDDHEIIDLSFDETMSKTSNDRVRMFFYDKRIAPWLEDITGREIKV